MSLKPLKKIVSLIAIFSLLLTLLAACGETATPATTTNAVATTSVAVTSASVATSAAAVATTAGVTTAAAAATTAGGAVATTIGGGATGGASDVIENYKPVTDGKKGGQLVYGFAGQFPSKMQPYYINDTVARIASQMAYAKPVGQSSKSKYYAYLATEVPTLDNGDVKINADNTMNVTIKLKPGLKWSDGSALTSKDFAFTWKWVTDPANNGISIDLQPWQLITGVDTPDDSTVVLKFKQVYGPYLNFLINYWVLPQKTWANIPVAEAQKNAEALKPTITSGPMKVDDFVADDRVTLSRNDNFMPVWGMTAYLDKIIFKNSSDSNAALAGISKGDFDEVENLDDNQGDAASKVPNASYIIGQNFSWELLQYNLTNPLFQDKAVRQALSQAVNVPALVKQFRTPKTVQIPVNVVMPFSPFFNTSLQAIKYDVAGANKILDDAGWKAGSDGIRVKDGKKLAFVLSSTTAAVRKSTAEVMIVYWKAIGADVKFQGFKSTEFFGSYGSDGILARGKFDVAMFAHTSDVDPDAAYMNYHTSQIPTDANKGNGSNYGHISDPTLDKDLDGQRATPDTAKRKELWNDFQKVLYDNYYETPLYTRVSNLVLSNKVKNFKPNPSNDSNFWNVVELTVQ